VFVSAGNQSEEQVRCLCPEGDVADLTNNDQGVSEEFREIFGQSLGLVGGGEASEPLVDCRSENQGSLNAGFNPQACGEIY